MTFVTTLGTGLFHYWLNRPNEPVVAALAESVGLFEGPQRVRDRFEYPRVTELIGMSSATQTDGSVRQFQLTVGRTQWELAPGEVVDSYTYNGQVPGPELRVTEGDTVRVTVKNELDEPTTVHWHGVDVPSAMDGVADTSGPPIAPGDTFTYEFVATPAGTRWYRSHFDEMNQQAVAAPERLSSSRATHRPRDPTASTPSRSPGTVSR